MRVSAVLLLLVGWVSAAGVTRSPAAENLRMASTHEASVATTVGRKLRHALDEAYKKPRIGAGNPGQFDVTALVQEYLPVGTPIAEAIAILQAASFDIRREARNDDPSQPQQNLVVASIEPFERHLFWTYYSSLRIQLTPVQEAGVEVVGSLDARFKYPML